MIYSKKLTICIILISMAFTFSGVLNAAQVEVKRPNVLLIVGDDMAFGDIGAFGSEIETPTLDYLAKEGIKFSNFHATPVCSVTRSELLTGANNIEVGLGAFDYAVYPPAKGKRGYEGYLNDNALTIAQILKDAGYNTYTTGKWHLGGTHGAGKGPHEWGFSRSYGIYVGGSNHWNQEVMLPDVKDPVTAKALKDGKIPKVSKEVFQENGKEVERPVGVYSNDLYTSKMIEFMEKDRTSGKPFFAYLAYTTAHFPIQAPSTLIDKYYATYYKLGYEGLRKSRFKAMKKRGIISNKASYHDGKTDGTGNLVKSWSDLSDEQKKHQARIMATYSAMIDDQDRHISKIFDYLKETDTFNNTLIIYLTDNGPEGIDLRGKLSNPLLRNWVDSNYSGTFSNIGNGETNWQIGTTWANSATGVLSWWKGFVGEGGMRTPLIIRPPVSTQFNRKNSLSDVLVSVKDIPMTILDYVGIRHPGNKYKKRIIAVPSGVSMKKFLEGSANRVRTDKDWLAFELFGNKYVIIGEYKATRLRKGQYGDGTWHLYNIINDPGETKPLESKHPERLKKMISLYNAYADTRGIVPVAEDWNPYSAVSH